MLTHWALVLTTACYAWGARNTVTNASKFWGTTVSNSFRDKEYSHYRDMVFGLQCKLLRRQTAGIIVWDNFTRGNKIRDQRGGLGTCQLNGTHEGAHEVVPYRNLRWDSHPRIVNTYDRNQIQVGLPGLRSWESVSLDHRHYGSRIFMRGNLVPRSTSPCWTGARVKHLAHINTTARTLSHIEAVFSCKDDAHFDMCHNAVNTSNLLQFRDLCNSDSAEFLFGHANKFQHDSVREWNATADEPTKSLLLGFVGVDEGHQEGAGAAFMDLQLKYGVINENEDLSWALDDQARFRRMYSFGDAKTNENCAAFVNTLSDRPLSLEESSHQAEVFLDCFTNTMMMPGDWHTVMNAVQSLFKVYYDILIEPMKDFLGWSRIASDVRSNYYQSSTLMMFMNREYSRYLMHCFFITSGIYPE